MKQRPRLQLAIDCLIAQTALEQNPRLLHNDRDFDAMAPIIGLHRYH